jgi:hypothetical protein
MENCDIEHAAAGHEHIVSVVLGMRFTDWAADAAEDRGRS